MEPDRIRKDIPIYPGAVDLDIVGPDPATPIQIHERGQTEVGQSRVTITPHSGTPWAVTGTGVQPVGPGVGRCTFGICSPMYPRPAQGRPNTGIQLVKITPGRFAFGLTIPAHHSLDKQLPGRETQSVFDRLGRTLTEPTPGHGSPLMRAEKKCVTTRTTGRPTLPYWGTRL